MLSLDEVTLWLRRLAVIHAGHTEPHPDAQAANLDLALEITRRLEAVRASGKHNDPLLSVAVHICALAMARA